MSIIADNTTKAIKEAVDRNDLKAVFNFIKQKDVDLNAVLSTENYNLNINGQINKQDFDSNLNVYIVNGLLLDESPKSQNLKEKIIEIIFNRSNLNNRNQDFSTILHLMTERKSNQYLPKVVEYSHKMDYELKDSGGYTPLHSAILSLNLPMAKYLIDKGCDIFVKNHDNKTLLNTLSNFIYFNGNYANRALAGDSIYNILKSFYIKGYDFDVVTENDADNFMQQDFLKTMYEKIVLNITVEESTTRNSTKKRVYKI